MEPMATHNPMKNTTNRQSVSSHSILLALSLAFHKAKSIHKGAEARTEKGAKLIKPATLTNDTEAGGTKLAGKKLANINAAQLDKVEKEAQRIYHAAVLFCAASGIDSALLDDMANEHSRAMASDKKGREKGAKREGADTPAPALNGRNGSHKEADATLPA